MLCSPVKVNQHFGGHIASIFWGKGQAKQEISKKQAASIDSHSACCQLYADFLFGLLSDPENGGGMFL
jgi:hypothetical protein